MLQNYFKTMLRNMLKNKMHTGINVIGMAVAFTCSILIFLTVYFMFSFNHFHENKDRIFKAYHFIKGPDGDEYRTGMAYPIQPAIITENLGVEKATLIREGGDGVQYNGKDLELSVKLVDPDFLEMFSFPVLNGNKSTPLASLSDVVLSEKAAATIFNKEDAVGKTIKVKVNNQWKDLVVSAVLKDAPPNSTIKFAVLARTELHGNYASAKNTWDFQHSDMYVMLGKNTSRVSVEKKLRAFEKKVEPVDRAAMKKDGFIPDENGDFLSLRLYPLNELHFSPQISNGEGVNKPAMYIVLLIGILILLIACFNFVNINIGLSFNRSKEMGIRKCLGAGKRQVWLQVFGESFIVCFAALLIGIMGVSVLLKFMNQHYNSKMTMSMVFQPTFILILIAVLLLVSFIAGGYPSAIVSRMQTTEVLKGKFHLNKSGLLRNGLVVAQFVIACVLICSTIIIYQQFQHLRKAPLGYQTTSLISIPIRDGNRSREIVNQLRMRLNNQPSVVSVSGTTANLGVGKDGGTSRSMLGFGYKGGTVRTTLLGADYNILTTLGMRPIAGRDFSTSHVSDSNHSVIITESMAKQLAEKDALGLAFYPDSSNPALTVIGIVPDFHLYSMHEKADALMISLNPNEPLGYALVKVNTNNPLATMELIKNTYNQIEPGVMFKGSFVDENIERWYSTEKEMGKMFSVAALIAIILSCMGLFGLALISITQRVKEIGVRKVLGASVSGIAAMVTKDFIKPVVVAMLIAIPIAWWAMSKWLQDFTYRIQINWWVFALAAIIAIFIAVVTVCFHAIKAAVANPVKSLRSE